MHNIFSFVFLILVRKDEQVYIRSAFWAVETYYELFSTV